MYFGPCSTKNKETPQQKNAVDTVLALPRTLRLLQQLFSCLA
jgi:hypothetical protein